MRSIITSPQTLRAMGRLTPDNPIVKELHAERVKANAAELSAKRVEANGPIADARRAEIDIARQIDELRERRAELDSNASDLGKQAQAVLSAHNELQADDIIAGKQPRPMRREDAELVRKARQVAGSTPAALEKLERERSDLSIRLIEAKAAFAGAVFDDVRQRQKTAQQTITDALAAIAPELVDLLSLSKVQERYLDTKVTMKLTAGEAPPWSGEVVVKNLVEHIPIQFRSPALALEELHKQSSARAIQLTNKIEGNT